MELFFKQVDAFTDKAFSGNPAAVFLLEESYDDAYLQAIAEEMNLPETAFLRQIENNVFQLRWFTPTVEIELCGHATLASAHVLWEEKMADIHQPLVFQSKSGPLYATKHQDWIQLDFPLEPAQDDADPVLKELLHHALATNIRYVGKNKRAILVEIDSEDALRALTPDIPLLASIDANGVVITSQASNEPYDFVSRCFYPRIGIHEDPVTGSAHCCLADYWGRRLGKTAMLAYQASKRGGTLQIELSGKERVLLRGQAVTTIKGVVTQHLLRRGGSEQLLQVN